MNIDGQKFDLLFTNLLLPSSLPLPLSLLLSLQVRVCFEEEKAFEAVRKCGVLVELGKAWLGWLECCEDAVGG